MFSKNLILSFTDKETIWIKHLALIMTKFTPVILSTSSDNIYHVSWLSQIKLWFTVNQRKIERYLSGRVTSVFKGSIDNCCSLDGWVLSGFDGGYAGHGSSASYFPVIFVLYLKMIYPLKYH